MESGTSILNYIQFRIKISNAKKQIGCEGITSFTMRNHFGEYNTTISMLIIPKSDTRENFDEKKKIIRNRFG